MRGILRRFGLKMGVVTRKGFNARVRELSVGHAMLERPSLTVTRRKTGLGASQVNSMPS
jgi:transposase